MPSREQHCSEDLAIGLSREYPEIHKLLDQFAHYPDMKFLREHRKFLHHQEGIDYVTMRYGHEAGLAAKQHVISDCGHVPNAVNYYDGTCDNYGYSLYK